MCVKWPAGLGVQELKISSEPSCEVITRLHGRFRYGSFITIPIPRGQIFLTSPILLEIEYCIEDVNERKVQGEDSCQFALD